MALTRVLRSQVATFSHTFYVDETATDSSVTVVYTVTDATGTQVATGNASSGGVGTGRYTFTLAAQSTLQRGTVSWAATIAAAATTEYDQYEVVGGFFFGLTEGRASDADLSSTSKYPTADLRVKRTEVEQECETICDRSFVPRYDRVVLNGTGTSSLLLKLSDPVRSICDVRTIRSVRMAPQKDETFTAFSVAQLAALSVQPDGTLVRIDGNVFTEGLENIIVELEYGLDVPPSDLVQATLTRFRSRLNMNKSGIPDRAVSYQMGDLGAFRIDLPGSFKVGIPDVDAVYSRYSRRSGTGPGSGGRAIPASRSLDYNPQRYSVFHGGVR